MPLKRNMTLDKITEYLINDLKQSVINDVGPCVQNIGGGYFSIPRLVLSYVDYLGALYHGYAGGPPVVGRRRRFADARYAKTFLRDVFGTIDPNYEKYGALLWEIYRNGTIHLYEPLKLRNQNKVISWFTFLGSRRACVPIHIGTATVEHLVPYRFQMIRRMEFWWQPISLLCLYEDLLAAINEYSRQIAQSTDLESKFRQTADALQYPEHIGITWW